MRSRWELPAAIVAGRVADGLLGDPARFHPVAGFGALADRLEARIWRPDRAAGTVYVALLAGGAAAVAALVERTLRSRALRTIWGAAVVWTALGGRSLRLEASRMAAALEQGDLDGARRRAPALVGRDPSGLGAAELARAAVESVAENTADAVVGSLLWCAVAGVPGVAAHRAINTLDAMVGHRDERYSRFGWAAARSDDLVNWLPARATAALAVVLSPIAGGRPGPAWRVLRRDGRKHPSPNAGRVEAAFAGALGIRLGGANRYGSQVEERPALGDGARASVADIERAVALSRAVDRAAIVLGASLAWGLRR